MPTEIVRPDANDTISGSIQLFPGSGESAWENVDEVVSDNDTTYIYVADSGASSHVAWFSATNPSASSGTINSVTVYGLFKANSAGQGGQLWVGTLAGTQTSAGTGSISQGSYGEKSYEFTTDPNTGIAWTWAAINDLMIGIALQAFGGSKEMRCTQIWGVIDYTPLALLAYSQGYIIG